MAIPASGRDLTVIGRNKTDGLYYPGYIRSNYPDNDAYLVKFDAIIQQEVPRNHVIIIGGARPWPELSKGDFTLTKIQCKTSQIECYVPGIVLGVPIGLNLAYKFYTIKLYSGHTTCKRRSCIIKIGPDRYKDIINYIASLRYQATLIDNRKLLTKINTSTQTKEKKVKKHWRGRKVQIGTPLFMYLSKLHKHIQVPSSHGRSTRTSTPTIRTSSTRPSSRQTTTTTSSRRPTSTPVSSHQALPITRKTRLPKDTEVLAHWLDDGWFYFGRIAEQCDDDNDREQWYTVVDACGHREMIKREDLFTEEEHLFEVVQPNDKVIALHPSYIYSYAPATVTEVYEQGVEVRFYDEMVQRLPASEVYTISSRKFKEYVAYISARMEQITGDVIARDDKTGIYKPYTAKASDHKKQQVYLQTPNNPNTLIKQLAIHVFPVKTATQYNMKSWQYVLAPIDRSCTSYVPAKVTATKPTHLILYDGTIKENSELNQCFFINDAYYKNATNYLLNNSNPK